MLRLRFLAPLGLGYCLSGFAATAPRLDTAVSLPTASSTAFVLLSNGGSVAAHYRRPGIIEFPEVVEYSRKGEAIFRLNLETAESEYANSFAELPDGSYIVAGRHVGEGDCYVGGWAARFKDRALIWHKRYCPDSAGVGIGIGQAFPLGSDRILFAGPGPDSAKTASMAFLETDWDGNPLKSHVERIPGTAILDFNKTLPSTADDRLFIAYKYADPEGSVTSQMAIAFTADYRLRFEVDFPRDRAAAAYRIGADGGLALLGGPAWNYATDKDWYLRADANGKVLLDTSYTLLDSLDGVYVPPEDPAACVPDDSLGLAVAYSHKDRLALLKVDRTGRVIYHKKYRYGIPYGALYPLPSASPASLDFLVRQTDSDQRLRFDASGSTCAPAVGLVPHHAVAKPMEVTGTGRWIWAEKPRWIWVGKPFSATGRNLDAGRSP
jgi:hypothetical protein